MRTTAAQGPRGKIAVTEETPQYSDDLDTRLMMRFAAGDDAAFEQIVEGFQRQVYGVIHRYLGGSPAAEDCAQEVFLRLYRMRKSYKPTARLSTLVFRIATNLCLNYRRDEARRRTVPLDAPFDEDGASLAATIPDESAPEAGETLESRERAAIVRKALERIPDRQRIALVLHRFEGLSYADIAEAMETNVDAVKSLLSRARASLAEVLRSEIEAGNL